MSLEKRSHLNSQHLDSYNSSQLTFCTDEKGSTARLGDKGYRNVTDDPLNAHFRFWFGSELGGMMTLGVHEEDQMEMDSTEMWYITTRKQQLRNRRSLLLELQVFLKKDISGEGNLPLL